MPASTIWRRRGARPASRCCCARSTCGSDAAIEAFGDRQGFRGAFVQAAIVIALTGIVVPATDASIWSAAGSITMLYVVFPSTLAATLAADSFAGERERRTLETLLATPLSDGAIFCGKVAAAVLFVMALSLASLASGVVSASVAGRLGDTLLPPELFAGVAAGAFVGALLTAAVATTVSMRVPVARSAQQMASMLTLLLAGLAATALRRMRGELDWPLVLATEALLLVAALAAVVVAVRLFRRERFFEVR